MLGNHVEGRIILRVLTNVASKDVPFFLRKVARVGLRGVLVPLASEDTFSADCLEANSQSANSSKQVDEAKRRATAVRSACFGVLVQDNENRLFGLRLPIFIAAGRALCHADKGCRLLKTQSSLKPHFRELTQIAHGHTRTPIRWEQF